MLPSKEIQIIHRLFLVIAMYFNKSQNLPSTLLFSDPYFGPDFFKVPDPKKYQVDLIN